MHALSLYLAISLPTAVLSGVIPATRSTKNPALRSTATLNSTANGIQATFGFHGHYDRGTFVTVQVLSGLSTNRTDGPFSYHIHTNPVKEGGDCSEALGHLDPFLVTESLVCHSNYPQFCQEGDLSGKHGKFLPTEDGSIATFGYTDDYLRFFPADVSILGRSIVIHNANKTRLACGNIISSLDGTADAKGAPTNKPSNFVTSYPKVAPVNPSPVLDVLNGTTIPSNAVLDNLPWQFPFQALSIKQALYVQYAHGSINGHINGKNVTTDRAWLTELPGKNTVPFKVSS